jgi:hypothetical protein
MTEQVRKQKRTEGRPSGEGGQPNAKITERWKVLHAQVCKDYRVGAVEMSLVAHLRGGEPRNSSPLILPSPLTARGHMGCTNVETGEMAPSSGSR